jgi:hypothetical protein
VGSFFCAAFLACPAHKLVNAERQRFMHFSVGTALSSAPDTNAFKFCTQKGVPLRAVQKSPILRPLGEKHVVNSSIDTPRWHAQLATILSNIALRERRDSHS